MHSLHFELNSILIFLGIPFLFPFQYCRHNIIIASTYMAKDIIGSAEIPVEDTKSVQRAGVVWVCQTETHCCTCRFPSLAKVNSGSDSLMHCRLTNERSMTEYTW